MSEESTDTQWPIWEVFVREEDGKPHVHAGSVHAPDEEMALQNARDVYSRRSEAISIWVARSEAFSASTPQDRESFFDPADDKIYRHPQFYKVPRGTRKAQPQ
jgi:ring-1,2-phenylacetyl-CoA epoxidase subunit PaaB